jgi:hypothetical protein
MIHSPIVATVTKGIALNDIPTKLETQNGMRKPITKQALDKCFSCLGSIAYTPVLDLNVRRSMK